MKPSQPIASASQPTTSPLDGDRRRSRPPRGNILIEHAGQQIGGRGNRLARAQHVAEEARSAGPAVVDYSPQVIQGTNAYALFLQRFRE